MSGEAGLNNITIALPTNDTKHQRIAEVEIVSGAKSVTFYIKQNVIQRIYYTSTDGRIVTPYATKAFDAEITSNTYTDGQGVITFNKPLTQIGKYAFSQCENLQSIVIPDEIKVIGERAFQCCTSLKCVTFGKGVTSVGIHAFYDCSLDDLYITDLATWCNIDFEDQIARPESVNTYVNSEIVTGKDLIIPEGVTIIKDYTLLGGCGATNVSLPYSVVEIGKMGLASCNNITWGEGLKKIGDYACLNLNSEEIVIPDSVEKIGVEAFAYCENLTKLTIGRGVTTINYQAFSQCEKLSEVTILGDLISVGYRLFSYCDALMAFYGNHSSEDNRCFIVDGVLHGFARSGISEYSIPEGVITIGEEVFMINSELTSITLPSSVTTIREYAFCWCQNLLHFYCKSTTPPKVEKNAFFFTNSCAMKIYIPIGSLEAYINADYWKNMYDSGFEFVEYDFGA